MDHGHALPLINVCVPVPAIYHKFYCYQRDTSLRGLSCVSSRHYCQKRRSDMARWRRVAILPVPFLGLRGHQWAPTLLPGVPHDSVGSHAIDEGTDSSRGGQSRQKQIKTICPHRTTDVMQRSEQTLRYRPVSIGEELDLKLHYWITSY